MKSQSKAPGDAFSRLVTSGQDSGGAFLITSRNPKTRAAGNPFSRLLAGDRCVADVFPLTPRNSTAQSLRR